MDKITDTPTTLVRLFPAGMLAPLRDAVLGLSPTEKGDALVYVRGAVKVAYQRLREIGNLLDEQLLAWMDANGDLIVDEQTRLYIGTKKTVKCRDVGACLAALEEAAGGEIEKVVECLSSSAWKHGACRQLLGPEKYEKCFAETVEQDVKTGKPIKAICESNQYTQKRINQG